MPRGMTMDMDVDGVSSVLVNLEVFEQVAKVQFETQLKAEAAVTLRKSLRLVPFDKGNLQASAHINDKVDDDEVKVVIGYGGKAGIGNFMPGRTNRIDVGYAADQHESVEYDHDVGQAKFLEEPFNRRAPGIARRVARKIKVVLRTARIAR